MRAGVLTGNSSLPVVRDEPRQKRELSPMAEVIVSNGAAEEIVLGRSRSDELMIEFAMAVRVGGKTNLANYCRFVNIGARRDKGVLRLFITESPAQRDRNGLTMARMRVAVPENVRVEFASEGDRMVCEELPAVLVLKKGGLPHPDRGIC